MQTLGSSAATPARPLQLLKSETLAVCVGAVVVTVLWTLYAGKDSSWDVVNHHLYLPFSLLSGRHVGDLFAAGPQSYLSPLGYLPGYLMVRAGLPGWAVGIGLATLHALPAAWGLHRITLALWGAQLETRRWRLLAVAMAWCAPIFLLLAGTTSSDPLSAGLVLLAVAAAVERRPRLPMMVVGGFALGLAIAVKPTNGVFAVALLPVIALRCWSAQLRWPCVVVASAAVIVGAMAGLWYWAGWLWRAFGNPVFPLFNHWFESPYAPAGAASAGRFLAQELWDLPARLWQMATFRSYTMTEAFVPDLRPLSAALLVAAALALWMWRRATSGAARTRALAAWAGRADAQILVLLSTAYPLWLASSGNARYLVAWFLLVGVLLVRAAERVLPARVAAVAIGVLLAVQTTAYVSAGTLRFNEARWGSERYIEASVPQRLQQQPFLHLSLGIQTFAAIALFLHPDGALINVAGQMAMPTQGPLGEAFKSRLRQWDGRTRFLMPAPPALDRPPDERGRLARMRYATYRLGLEVDWDDCERLWLDPHVEQTLAHAPGSTTGTGPLGVALVSCAARPVATADPDIDARVAQADRVFELIEASCPHIFGPRPFASDVGPDIVQRLYMSTDARVTVSQSDGVQLTHFRSASTVSMGSIDHVVATRGSDACLAWNKLNRQ